jgi:CheY-like chemotaxis protein
MKKRQKPPVLVVDDNIDIGVAVRWLLEDEGYEMLWTGDGVSALNILRSTDSCFVVLLDYLMPGVGGDEVLATVAADPHLSSSHTFILMTATAKTIPPRTRHLLETLVHDQAALSGIVRCASWEQPK